MIQLLVTRTRSLRLKEIRQRDSPKRFRPQTITEYLFGSVQVKQTDSDKLRKCDILNKKHRDVYACLRAPAWLINKVWEIQAHNVYGSWEFRFSATRTHDRHSPIHEALLCDDTEELKVLLQTGQVSILDNINCGNKYPGLLAV